MSNYFFAILITATCMWGTLSTLQAQQLLPLEGNPTLQAHHQQRLATRSALLKPYEDAVKQMPMPELDPELRFECIAALDTYRFCIDTFGGGDNFQINCLSCDQLSLGSITQFGNCFEYVAGAMDSIASEQPIDIVYCDSAAVCDTFRFHFLIHRKGEQYDGVLTILEPGEFVNIEVDYSQLPGPLIAMYDLGCNDPLLGETVVTANRIFYTAGRFSGIDTVCVQIASEYCVWDTIRYTFRTVQDTLSAASLPFQDDFSGAGSYPDSRLWLDDRAYINRGFGTNVPTIGVASLDGLDANGNPYGGGYGVSDVLTSAYLNLQADSVPFPMYLSFFYQYKGNGYSLAINDSLVLEFKNANGGWDRIDGFVQDTFYAFDYKPEFTFVSYELDESYKYRGFQFRFINYSDNGGTLEPWNLDVVRLSAQAPDPQFSDIAFVKPPSSALKNYSAMPFRQLRAKLTSELRTVYRSTTRNNLDFTVAITDDAFRIRTAPFDANSDLISPLSPLTGNIEANSLKMAQVDLPSNDFNQLVSELEALDADAHHELVVRHAFQPGIGDDLFEQNNTTQTVTPLTNYYAYDDGSAERRLTPGGSGNRLAVRFEAHVPDTLKAVQFQFPFYPSSKGRTFRLQVWIGELDDSPEYEELFAEPFYVSDVRDTLSGITTYVLTDISGEQRMPLFVPPGPFWVGYETNAKDIPVGFDVNSPQAASSIYFYNGVAWKQLDSLSDNFKGALMVRAVLGKGKPVSSVVHNAVSTQDADWHVFPNPVARQTLNIRPANDHLMMQEYVMSIFTAAGSLYRQFDFVPKQINAQAMNPGTYILHIQRRDGAAYRWNRQIIVIR